MEPFRGRAVIDRRGTILRADLTFAAIVGTAAAALPGRSVLDFCPADDRDAVTAAFAGIGAGTDVADLVGYVLRDDGSRHLARGLIAPLPGEPGHYAVDLDEVGPPDDRMTPRDLLRFAQISYDARRIAVAAFDGLVFADSAGDILLAAYIREAEGSLLSLAEARAAVLSGSPDNAGRWLRALESEGVIEVDAGGVRLSTVSHRRFERFLSRSARLAAASRATDPAGSAG